MKTKNKSKYWVVVFIALCGGQGYYTSYKILNTPKIAPVAVVEAKVEEIPISEHISHPASENEAIPDVLTGEFSAYTSEPGQTDSSPFIMASGNRVYAGAIANNCLPFGSKIKVNGKIKIVEDRMNRRYGCEHFDIWMEEKTESIQFGRRKLEYEIIN